MPKGLFVVLESVSKCGKTTLARALVSHLERSGQFPHITHKRGALTESPFGKQVASLHLDSVAYSTAFYWADLVFDTADTKWLIEKGHIVVQERYDLSVVAYRRMHGLIHDELLQRAYLDRDMLLAPDLTVFLAPPKDKVLERIESSLEGSSVDRELLGSPGSVDVFQESIRRQLKDLARNYLILDTSVVDIDGCVEQVVRKLESLRGGKNGE